MATTQAMDVENQSKATHPECLGIPCPPRDPDGPDQCTIQGKKECMSGGSIDEQTPLPAVLAPHLSPEAFAKGLAVVNVNNANW